MENTDAAIEVKDNDDDDDVHSSTSSHHGDEGSEDGELEDDEIASLRKENARLKRKLDDFLYGPVSNYGVYCTVTYNRLSVSSQMRIEDILQREYDEIDREREDDTAAERREEEEEDKEEAPPRKLMHYYKGFIIDKMGSKNFLEKTNVMSLAPTYDRATSEALGEVPEPAQVESSPRTPRARGACWNCGSTDHQLIDCPQPRNRAVIEEKRREHLENTPSTPKVPDVRYYGETSVDKALLDTFKPGKLSQPLKDALGMKANDLPPYYAAMRIHGYPPSYSASELEMEDPLAKESNDPLARELFPGLGIPPSRTPTPTPYTPNATPTKSSVHYPATPNSPPLSNNHNPNSPNGNTPHAPHNFAIPAPRGPLIPIPFPLNPALHNPAFMLYAAANANRNPQAHQQMQHISAPPPPPASTQSDLTEADMDVT